jgi:glutaredoxin
MKYSIIFVTLFGLCISLSAGNTSARPGKNSLTEKKWYLTGKQQNIDDNMLKYRKNCEMDNYVIFHQDETYEQLEGESRCRSSAPGLISKGKWKLDGSELWLDGNWNIVIELTGGRFVYTTPAKDFPILYTYELTPKKIAGDEKNSNNIILVKQPVKVYYNDNCPRSDQVIKYFTANKVPFEKFKIRDSKHSNEIREHLRKAGYSSSRYTLYMPVMVINDKAYWDVDDLDLFFKRLKIVVK